MFVWLIITNFNKTESIIVVLLHGKIQWIILAALIQVVYYFVYPYFMQKIFDLLQMNIERNYLKTLYLATKFTDLISPSSSVSKFGLFLAVARKLDKSGSRMVASTILLLVFDTLSFVLISLPIFLYVLYVGRVLSFTFWPYVILFLLMVIVLILLSLVIQNKLRLLTSKIPLQRVREFFESLHDIKATTGILREAYVDTAKYGLINHLLNIATLAAIFLAFDQPINIALLLQVYLAGILFTIISITPQGLGSAEPLMILSMTSQGVPFDRAAVITLAFRGILFWLPVFPGFFAFRQITKEDSGTNVK